MVSEQGLVSSLMWAWRVGGRGGMLERGHCHLGLTDPVALLLLHSAFYVALRVVDAHFQACSPTPVPSPEESGIIRTISDELVLKVINFIISYFQFS